MENVIVGGLYAIREQGAPMTRIGDADMRPIYTGGKAMAFGRRIWTVLQNWFWIPRFDRLVEGSNLFVFRLLRIYAWIFMVFYLVVAPLMLIMAVINFDVVAILGSLVGLVLFPLMFRVVMGVLTGFWVSATRWNAPGGASQVDWPAGRTWWGRNWKWALAALVIGIPLTITPLVFSMIKSSDAFKEAITKAKAHPLVQETIGTPIREALFVSGSLSVSGPSGRADLAIPVSGPRGKGTIYVVAAKSAGRWTFSTLILEIEQTKQRMDLLK